MYDQNYFFVLLIILFNFIMISQDYKRNKLQEYIDIQLNLIKSKKSNESYNNPSTATTPTNIASNANTSSSQQTSINSS